MPHHQWHMSADEEHSAVMICKIVLPNEWTATPIELPPRPNSIRPIWVNVGRVYGAQHCALGNGREEPGRCVLAVVAAVKHVGHTEAEWWPHILAGAELITLSCLLVVRARQRAGWAQAEVSVQPGVAQ